MNGGEQASPRADESRRRGAAVALGRPLPAYGPLEAFFPLHDVDVHPNCALPVSFAQAPKNIPKSVHLPIVIK